jgi:hypothetical protein
VAHIILWPSLSLPPVDRWLRRWSLASSPVGLSPTMAHIIDDDGINVSAPRGASAAASAEAVAAKTKSHDVKVSPLAKKFRISKPMPIGGGAKFIQTESLASLVSSYHKHFGEYSRTRTRVVQRVPGKVWKQVYADYKAEEEQACCQAGMEYDEQKLPAERTLQDALRAALDPDTGVSDPSGAAKVVPQSKEILRALKNSDGNARRVMLRHPELILGGAAQSRVGDVDVTNMQDDDDDVRFVGDDVIPGKHSSVDGSRVDAGGDDISVRVSNDSINSRC